MRSDFGSPLDVLAAVRYLHEKGAKTVSIRCSGRHFDVEAIAVGRPLMRASGTGERPDRL